MSGLTARGRVLFIGAIAQLVAACTCGGQHAGDDPDGGGDGIDAGSRPDSGRPGPSFGPAIYSHPETMAIEGRLYLYPVLAEDRNGDPLVFSLPTAPAGMSIDAETGLIEWTPPPGSPGMEAVVVRVVDPEGLYAEQPFDVMVQQGTQRPRITSVPSLVGTRGTTYTYDATVEDPDDTSFTWTLPTAPAGATIDGSGHLSWPVPGTAGGNHPFTLRVTDPTGLVFDQTFSVGVESGFASPTVGITSPATSTTWKEPAPIIGTATDDDLAGYVLEACPTWDSNGCTTIGQGLAPVVNAPLGVLDTTLLANGEYALRLTATDAGGRQSTAEITVTIEGDLKPGAVRLVFEDLVIDTSYGQFVLRRIYDGLDRRRGDFGHGWRLEVQAPSVTYSQPVDPDVDWRVECFAFPPSCEIFEDADHTMYITVGGDRDYEVHLGLISDGGLSSIHTAYPIAQVALGDATAEVLDEGGVPVTGFDVWVWQDDGTATWDDLRFYPFKPQIRLNTAEGEVFVFDTETKQLISSSGGGGGGDGLQIDRSVDPPRVLIEGAEVARFTRGANGFISSVQNLLNGETLVYTQDVNDDLVGVAETEGMQEYAYAPEHRLASWKVPGEQPTVVWYDERGRAIRTRFPTGAIEEITYLDDRNLVKTDAMGNTMSFEFDAEGRLLHTVDPLGHEWRMEYTTPEQDLPTRKIDPWGRAWTNGFDADGRHTSTRDPLGNERRWVFDERRQVVDYTDAEGHRAVRAKDGEGRPTSVTVDGQTQETYTYPNDTSVAITNARGHQDLYSFDDGGRLATHRDWRGGTSTFSYDDAAGTRTTTEPDGTSFTASIDRLGRMTEAGGVTYEWGRRGELPKAATGPGGERMEFQRARDGSLGKIVVDGAVLYERRLDAMGRVASESSPTGGVSYRYDATGKVIEATTTDDETMRFTYDAAGRVLTRETMDGDGAMMEALALERDAAGRVTAVENMMTGDRLEMTLDANGRVTSASGIDGTDDDFAATYDASGRVTERRFPGGLTERYRYATPLDQTPGAEPDGFTDLRGVALDWTRDGDGRITHAVDGAGGTNDYVYDPEGRVMQVTDAEGRSVTYDWGDDGPTMRRTAEMREDRYGYAMGRPTTWTRADATVIRWEYLAEGMRTVDQASGDEWETTYDPTTLVISETTTSTGDVVRYFDDAGQRLQWIETGPNRLNAEYDDDGRMTSAILEGPTGSLETAYGYDADGNLASIVDPDGRSTSFTWSSGRLTGITRPNGTSTTFVWTTHPRPDRIEHYRGGTLSESYQYTFDAQQRIQRLVAPDGTYDFEYDVLSRLTRERKTGAGAYDRRYTWDRVGNLVRIDDGASVTTFSHDDDDRLISSSAPSGTTTYVYAERGSLERIEAPEGTTTFEYDGLDRLTRVTRPGGVVETFRWSAKGMLLGGTDAGGGWSCLPVPASMIGGAQRCFATWRDATPEQASLYTFGPLGIASRHDATDPGAARYVWTRDLGSVVAWTDPTGAISGQRAYDAWGRIASQTGEAFPFGFTSAFQTGDQVLMGYRFYDARLRRMLTLDGVEAKVGDTLTTNRYAYAKGDPLNAWDPDGNETLVAMLSVQGIQQTLNRIHNLAVLCIKNQVKSRIIWMAIEMGAQILLWGIQDQLTAMLQHVLRGIPAFEDEWLFWIMQLLCGRRSSGGIDADQSHWSFFVDVRECGEPRNQNALYGPHSMFGRASCTSANLTALLAVGQWAVNFFRGWNGIDIVYTFQLSRNHYINIPIELKLSHSAYDPRQLVRWCRFAARKAHQYMPPTGPWFSGTHLVMYLYARMPADRHNDDAARKCWGCWGAQDNLPGNCSNAGTFGSLYIAFAALGHGQRFNRRVLGQAHVYVPRPNVLGCGGI